MPNEEPPREAPCQLRASRDRIRPSQILIAQFHAGQRADRDNRILDYGVWDLQRRVQTVLDHNIRINGPQGASLRLIAAKEAS